MRISVVFLGVLFASAVAAQTTPEPQPTPPPFSETIEVGSRSTERSRTDTPVPVDVLPVDEVADEAGQLDVGQLLQFTAPSFNSNRQSGSDGSDHVDAATLRGLGPDQVLVLINGKRRHTSSLVYLFGTRGRGNVGTDLNTIPVSAIERIEILRDGAAAQYGSDAIAGVINIVLKKDRGLDVLLSGGQFTAGDGQNEQLALNYGARIGTEGALSLTGEILNRDKTNRATPDEPRVIGDAATENLTLFSTSICRWQRVERSTATAATTIATVRRGRGTATESDPTTSRPATRLRCIPTGSFRRSERRSRTTRRLSGIARSSAPGRPISVRPTARTR